MCNGSSPAHNSSGFQESSATLVSLHELRFGFIQLRGAALQALKGFFLLSTKLLQLRFNGCLCNDEQQKKKAFSDAAAGVCGLGQVVCTPPTSPRSCWPVKVLGRAGPQAQDDAHGYPWVFWHQRKRWHTDGRWACVVFQPSVVAQRSSRATHTQGQRWSCKVQPLYMLLASIIYIQMTCLIL